MSKRKLLLSIVVMSILARSFAGADGIEKKMVNRNGKAPSLSHEGNNVFMAYASGDSIFYSISGNKGSLFTSPELVAVLPKLGVGGGRGPQIISAKNQLLVVATDNAGNIYSFTKNKNANSWKKRANINDVPEVAKEGFVSLAANNKGEIYAVWLDLREDKKNKIAGAKSVDGGKTWSKNKVIYKSPDSTVCECCKPSVEMKGEMVVVMFRNWLNGNRDLHIIKSDDGGLHFGNAQKLGEGSWKLNACPMDGGGLVINADNSISTVWRRQETIYRCKAGEKEEMIATGKQCVIAGNTRNIFISYMNGGKVYCRKPGGNQIELGNGGSPKLTMTGSNSVLCAWEYDGRLYYASVTK